MTLVTGLADMISTRQWEEPHTIALTKVLSWVVLHQNLAIPATKL